MSQNQVLWCLCNIFIGSVSVYCNNTVLWVKQWFSPLFYWLHFVLLAALTGFCFRGNVKTVIFIVTVVTIVLLNYLHMLNYSKTPSFQTLLPLLHRLRPPVTLSACLQNKICAFWYFWLVCVVRDNFYFEGKQSLFPAQQAVGKCL